MKILNKTKDITLSEDAVFASSFYSRARGLIFSGPRDMVLVSPSEDIRSSSIHMMFMGFPIDVVWVDSNMVVVDVRRQVRPAHPLKPSTWGIYRPAGPAKYVVELGAGSAGNTEIGDIIYYHPPGD